MNTKAVHNKVYESLQMRLRIGDTFDTPEPFMIIVLPFIDGDTTFA